MRCSYQLWLLSNYVHCVYNIPMLPSSIGDPVASPAVTCTMGQHRPRVHCVAGSAGLVKKVYAASICVYARY